MSSNTSIEKLTVEEIANIPEADVPMRIDQCMGNLGAIQQRVTSALKKATTSKSLSDKAKGITLHWYKIGDKAKAIEALQDAMVGVADAQGDQAVAIKQLLEYQESVAKGMKFLLALGVANLANGRTVVKQLEMRLKNKSEEEISEMARNEMRAVIAQVKAQLDLQERQDRLSADQKKVKERVKASELDIDLLSKREDEQDQKIAEGIRADAKQDRELARQAKKDEEHDSLLAARAKDDEAQNRELARQAAKDKEHDAALRKHASEGKKRDAKIDANSKQIAANAKGIAENSEGLATVSQSVSQNSDNIKQNAKGIHENADCIERNSIAIAGVQQSVKRQRHALARAIIGGGAARVAVIISSIALAVSLLTAMALLIHVFK